MIGDSPKGTVRFEYRPARSGGWRVRLVASNGRILLSSEVYRTLHGCDRMVHSVYVAFYGAPSKRPRVWRLWRARGAARGRLILRPLKVAP